ncbi:hypothetical protein GPECTOR_52g62 [Gonium pectorale]|uniref:Uncharacterized protein n=1 Tax=Gonium pectorale TaxID=33097 RepID=A0A150G751_GONPE|nr:hypothetical protein GPECTOR_52g62 [Gonium pectorale]|eukprot:KXZ45664.1 hypothetical protein GPECTOR_52g62 [Gonium pectorale]
MAMQTYRRQQTSRVDPARYLYMPVLSGFRSAPAEGDGASTPSALYKRYKLSEEKTFASFFHPDKEALLKLVDQFLTKSGKFSIPGYPQKLGFLLYGPPGTGKTSLIKALAQHTKSLPLIRLVNGISDSQQKGRVASSVAVLSDAAGLPRALVDVRHEATHNELPSLPLLRAAADSALAWLRENYWEGQRQALAAASDRIAALLTCLADSWRAAAAAGLSGSGGTADPVDDDDDEEVMEEAAASYSGPEGQRIRKQALSDLRSLLPPAFTHEMIGPLLDGAALRPPALPQPSASSASWAHQQQQQQRPQQQIEELAWKSVAQLSSSGQGAALLSPSRKNSGRLAKKGAQSAPAATAKQQHGSTAAGLDGSEVGCDAADDASLDGPVSSEQLEALLAIVRGGTSELRSGLSEPAQAIGGTEALGTLGLSRGGSGSGSGSGARGGDGLAPMDAPGPGEPTDHEQCRQVVMEALQRALALAGSRRATKRRQPEPEVGGAGNAWPADTGNVANANDDGKDAQGRDCRKQPGARRLPDLTGPPPPSSAADLAARQVPGECRQDATTAKPAGHPDPGGPECADVHDVGAPEAAVPAATGAVLTEEVPYDAETAQYESPQQYGGVGCGVDEQEEEDVEEEDGGRADRVPGGRSGLFGALLVQQEQQQLQVSEKGHLTSVGFLL